MALQSTSTQRRLLTTPEMGVPEAPPGSNGSSIQDVQDLPPRDLAVLCALSSTDSSSALKMCIFLSFCSVVIVDYNQAVCTEISSFNRV